MNIHHQALRKTIAGSSKVITRDSLSRFIGKEDSVQPDSTGTQNDLVCLPVGRQLPDDLALIPAGRRCVVSDGV